jgi:hypothetical protein
LSSSSGANADMPGVSRRASRGFRCLAPSVVCFVWKAARRAMEKLLAREAVGAFWLRRAIHVRGGGIWLPSPVRRKRIP